MKITIEADDGELTVFSDVTDYYVAVRTLKPATNKEGDVAMLPETRSFSNGANLRELAKEIYQSYLEIQEYLKRSLGVQTH